MKLHLKFAMLFILIAALAFTACDDGGGSSGGGSGTDEDGIVSIAAIKGVTPPAYGETPVTSITETDQYTGTVSWDPVDNPFEGETVYTATITLTAKTGFTLTDVTENFFSVAGAVSVLNAADSGVVTAEFPATTYTAGDMVTYTADGVSFNMAYVPGGLTFPTGMADDGTDTVDDAYWIGETAVTYELWEEAYNWAATDSGGGTRADGGDLYYFANQGREGEDGMIGAAATNQEPATTINWRDSIVWCNALTEWYNAQNGTSYECVYTYSSAIIRDSRDSNATACDNAVAGSTAKGFRLLTNNEWDLAARYRGTDTTNVVTGIINSVDFDAMAIKWTKGNSASGATTYYNDNTNGSGEPGKSANDSVAVYRLYHNGTTWVETGVTSTAEVKSKTANELGLYDMSGNVWEWCFDKDGTIQRLIKGGYWYGNAFVLQVGYYEGGGFSSRDEEEEFEGLGFRIARSAD